MFAISFIVAQTFYTTTPETVISWIPFLFLPWKSLSQKLFVILILATVIQIIFFVPKATLTTASILLAPLVF